MGRTGSLETGSADQATLVMAGVAAPLVRAPGLRLCASPAIVRMLGFNNMGRQLETESLPPAQPMPQNQLPGHGCSVPAEGAAVDVVTKYGEGQRSLCNKCHVQD
jgi:hypothetical protein